jgi:hypothetical protein
MFLKGRHQKREAGQANQWPNPAKVPIRILRPPMFCDLLDPFHLITSDRGYYFPRNFSRKSFFMFIIMALRTWYSETGPRSTVGPSPTRLQSVRSPTQDGNSKGGLGSNSMPRPSQNF